MKEFLQGKWLGHPLHSVLVHLPTSLWPVAMACDWLSRAGLGGEELTQASFYSIALGLVSALAAVPAGLADWLDIGKGKPARKIGLAHMLINLGVAAVWLVNLVLRMNVTNPPPGPRRLLEGPVDRPFGYLARNLAQRLARQPADRPYEPARLKATPLVPAILSTIGTLALAVSGYLGGRMVYGHGISVARLSKDRWRAEAVAGGARVPAPQGRGD